MKHAETIRRTAVAAAAIPLIIGAALKGGFIFTGFVFLVTAGSLFEFQRFYLKKSGFAAFLPGIIAVAAVCADMFLCQGRHIYIVIFIFFLFEISILVFSDEFQHVQTVYHGITGLIYCSFYTFFILIRQLPLNPALDQGEGGKIILLIFAGIWACDSSAYFAGTMIKKTHQLSENISPRKSWEGAAAGFSGAVLSVILLRYMVIPSLSWPDTLILGTCIGVFAQISDLSESVFKRAAGVKDSSRIIPGHGGILDRFDSSLLVAPICYLYLFLTR